MPFTFFGESPSYRSLFSGYQPERRSSAPPKLSLDDLYQPSAAAEYPEPPTYARGIGDLSEEERKRLRKLSMLKAVQAMGAGWSEGRAGSALLAAAIEMQQDQGNAVEAENRRREEQYKSAREMAMQALAARKASRQEDQERAGAQNRLSMYEQIAAMDPDLAAQAEGAARSGSNAHLYELLAEAHRRKAIREGGYGDPKDPFIEDKIRAKLRAEEDERQRRERLESLPEELRLRNEIEDEQLRNRIRTGLARDPNRRDEEEGDAPRWEPDQVTMIDPGTGLPAIFMVDKSQRGPDGRPLMTKIGDAPAPRARLEHFNLQDEFGNPRPYIYDPSTGESRPDPSFVQATKKEKRGGFLGIGGTEVEVPDPEGGYRYVPPVPPPAGQGSQARPRPRPTTMLDAPDGAPARGRGDGPAPAGRQPSPQERAGVGRSPEEVAAAASRIIAQVPGLKLKSEAAREELRRRLRGRLAAGADEQEELRKILEAMGGGQ